MKETINPSLPNEHCTGCGACKAICPKGAIVFRPDEGGFPYPQVDNSKCVHCSLCEKTCPALNPPERHAILNAYAAQYTDAEALRESSSGGIFTAFSREVFRRGGVVYGCVWDNEYNAIIKRASNEAEMKPMRGSKYVWSYAGDVFSEVKKELESGKFVLFSGLPCQVAGLKKYLRKEYEKLFLLDCLCSGSPSPLAFQKYLDTICSSKDRSTLDLKFRDKDPYGVGVHITYNGQKKKTAPRGEHVTNPYYYAFFSHLMDRLCCYSCPYGTEQRISDFTMSDYWGVANYHSDMDIKAGVSALLINSDKGALFLESVRNQIKLVPSRTENIGKANNLAYDGKIIKKRKIPDERALFFKELNCNGWEVAKRKYLFTFQRFKKILGASCPPRLLLLIKKIIKR